MSNTKTENKVSIEYADVVDNPYLAEAKRRIQLLRIMGLCEGPLNVSVKEVEQWCKERDCDPEVASLDEFAGHKVLEYRGYEQ
jgi:hypothetical protein